MNQRAVARFISVTLLAACGLAAPAWAQLRDVTQAPNIANEGIRKSLTDADRAGPGRLDDPRLVVLRHRARCLPRHPPRTPALPAQVHDRRRGLARRPWTGRVKSARTAASAPGSPTAAPPATAGRAARPGSAATSSPVPTAATRRTCSAWASWRCSADEITTDLRAIRAAARDRARTTSRRTRSHVPLAEQGHQLRRRSPRSPTARVDTSQRRRASTRDLRVQAVLRTRASTFSIREFVVGALNAEMGLEAPDADLRTRVRGRPRGHARPAWCSTAPWTRSLPPAAPPRTRTTTATDIVERDRRRGGRLPRVLPAELLQARAGTPDDATEHGSQLMAQIGCTSCHVRNLTVERDRRVADVETVYDPVRGIFNDLFATATPLLTRAERRIGPPAAHGPERRSRSSCANLFADFKRHDLGPELLGAQLRRHDPEALHDRAAVGSGLHRPLRPRRPQHDPARRDPPPRRRGPGRAGHLRRRCRELHKEAVLAALPRPSCCSRPTTPRPT